MKISTFPADWVIKNQQSSWIDSFARKTLFKILKEVKNGHLTIKEGEQVYQFGDANSDFKSHIHVSLPAFYRKVVFGGSVGAGEAYMSGCWQTPDLTKVVRFICKNMAQLEEIDAGLSSLSGLLDKLNHLRSPNSNTGSRKNIRAHYDLSNPLFETFLDKNMMYSSAVFVDRNDDLEKAQTDKLDALATMLSVNENHRVVEIGTGWGGMAIHLAKHYGCHVTTTTISQTQFEYASDWVQKEGLQDRVTVLDQDYRQLQGHYDRLISIEMIEAVGLKFMSTFFHKCDSLLKTGGKMVLQAITIPEQRYKNACNSVDFIQKYIFPGGFLPSVHSILTNTGEHTRLQIEQVDDIGLDYAKTLAAWRQSFLGSREQILGLGFDELFIRLWEFYFCYCEGGFEERAISTVQASFRKV